MRDEKNCHAGFDQGKQLQRNEKEGRRQKRMERKDATNVPTGRELKKKKKLFMSTWTHSKDPM